MQVNVHAYIHTVGIKKGNEIKTHGSESRGQEEAACTRIFLPTQPLVNYLHGWQL